MAAKKKSAEVEVKPEPVIVKPFAPVLVKDPTSNLERVFRVHCSQELERYLARGWVKHG